MTRNSLKNWIIQTLSANCFCALRSRCWVLVMRVLIIFFALGRIFWMKGCWIKNMWHTSTKLSQKSENFDDNTIGVNELCITRISFSLTLLLSFSFHFFFFVLCLYLQQFFCCWSRFRILLKTLSHKINEFRRPIFRIGKFGRFLSTNDQITTLPITKGNQ
jgi:hypothetical protein